MKAHHDSGWRRSIVSVNDWLLLLSPHLLAISLSSILNLRKGARYSIHPLNLEMSQPQSPTIESQAESPILSNDGSPAPSDAAALAKARREARKAKILAGGSDRLARITKSGRGEEAETLYKTHSPLNPSSPSTFKSTPTSTSTPTPTATTTFKPRTSSDIILDDDQDPEEIDISSMTSSLQRSNQDQQQQQQEFQDPFQAMMAAFSGGAQGMNGGPGGQENPFGGLPFDPSQFMAMMGGGGVPPQAGGGGGLNINGKHVQSGKKSTLDRFFDFSHSLIFILLGLFIAGSALRSSNHSIVGTGDEHGIKLNGNGNEGLEIEPTGDASRFVGGGGDHEIMKRWARLGYEKPTSWEAHYFKIPDLGLGMLSLQGVVSFAFSFSL